LHYRQGDEPPPDGSADDADWLVLVDSNGDRRLAFQQVERLERTTWPSHDVPMQMHLDFTVSGLAELGGQRDRRNRWGRTCCWTGQMTRTSLCTSWPTPQAILLASSSPDRVGRESHAFGMRLGPRVAGGPAAQASAQWPGQRSSAHAGSYSQGSRSLLRPGSSPWQSWPVDRGCSQPWHPPGAIALPAGAALPR
jgi:hypothetical protein